MMAAEAAARCTVVPTVGALLAHRQSGARRRLAPAPFLSFTRGAMQASQCWPDSGLISQTSSIAGVRVTTQSTAQDHGRALSRAVSSIVCSQAIEELPANLQKIVKAFKMVPDPMLRYRQLLYFATKLQPLAPEHHTQENKVVGCVSQVWVLPELRDDGRVYFQADSDSQLTKGLAALLVEGLSGATPADILRVTPDFIEDLGLRQKLTPSRSNGFLNMFKLMQKKTLQLYMAAEAASKAHGGSASKEAPTSEARTPSASAPGGNGTATERASSSAAPAQVGTSEARGGPSPELQLASSRATEAAQDGGSNGAADGNGGVSGRPVYRSIKTKLESALKPLELEIVDDSAAHAGHAGIGGGDIPERVFNVRVVSESFEGVSRVKRHQMIYALLDDEFKQGMHALSLITKTPKEVGLVSESAKS